MNKCVSYLLHTVHLAVKKKAPAPAAAPATSHPTPTLLS